MPHSISTERRFCCTLLPLLLLLNIKAATAQNISNNATPPASGNSFVPHRFSSNNNITILHEVHEVQKPTADPLTANGPRLTHLTTIVETRPLVLNTHEVLPVKTVKKKPYTLLDKGIFGEYEKPTRPLKEYELHPVTFDFNLGDLEDLEHETIKKGDLSAEEKLLLRSGNGNDNANSDTKGSTKDLTLTYTERTLDADSAVGGEANGAAIRVIATAAAATASGESGTSSVSPHIFKVVKGKTLKKGRELLKHPEADETHKNVGNTVNSISQYFGGEEALSGVEANASVARLQASNVFQLITNLYDHFYWQPKEIRSKVSTACALEMQGYLTALRSNYNWAQKAYDASGRYRGQIFFGNDKWLGQMNFCYELNRQLQPDERKHFEFQFFAVFLTLRLSMPQKLETNLQLGECLPKSCSSQDVHAILSLDPHALQIMAVHNNNNNAGTTNLTADNHTSSSLIQVRRVRVVPGPFSYWSELKFQLFVSCLLTLLLLVIAATWYQSRLNQLLYTSPHIPAISAKIDSVMATHTGAAGTTIIGPMSGVGGGDSIYSSNGKSSSAGASTASTAFELYQMSPLNGSNNVLELEAADMNGNRTSTSEAATIAIGAVSAASGGEGSGNDAPNLKSVRHGQMRSADIEKTRIPEYALETDSSAGATGTYEAKKQLGLPEQFLLCFAFQTNAGTIFNITDNKEFTRNITERSVWYQFVGNATFSVDTFFFISGFLVTLLFLRQEKKYPEDTGQFARRSLTHTGFLLLYRYIRLTPAYLFVIFFNDFTLRETFNNSVFQPNVAADTCSQYWWRNIFYINNFYPLSEICMIWSWYMANDMQFFIMATLLLVLSTRYFKTVVIVVCSLLLSSWGVSGIISLHYHYTHKVANPFESFDFLYDKPWQRVGTYIMGMFAGFLIYKVKKPPQVSNRTCLLLWAGSLGLLALIIFGVWNGELSRIATAFYVSVGHSAFGLALVWIVLSCCWGLTPTINRVLSYRALWPLSRLTYCTYLIHPVIMLITSFRMSGPVHLNNLFVLIIFLGNAVASFGVAFFISMLFEAPVIRILKMCFRK